MITTVIKRLSISLILSLLIITPCGFYTKFYTGPAQQWVADNLSGVFYEIFWCLLFKLFCQRCKDLKITLLVLCVTIGIEFLQLWHPPILELLRQNFLGRTLLGTSFGWIDIPYYFLGCGIAYGWLKLLDHWAELTRLNSSAKYSAK